MKKGLKNGFWNEWIEGDLIKREELVSELPFFNQCVELLSKSDAKGDELLNQAFTLYLNGYFEDLENVICQEKLKVKN